MKIEVYSGDISGAEFSYEQLQYIPKFKNILNNIGISSGTCKIDNESIYLKKQKSDPSEIDTYYKISPYEIDTSVYGNLGLSTSFNASYYSTNPSITLNTKNEYVLLKIVPPKIGSYDIQSNKISYGNGYEYDVSNMDIANSYSNIHDEYFLTENGSIKYVSKHNIYSDSIYYLSIDDRIYENPDGSTGVTRTATLEKITGDKYSIDIGYGASNDQVIYIIGNGICQDRYDKYENGYVSKNILTSSSTYSTNIFNDASYEMYSGSQIRMNLSADNSPIYETNIELYSTKNQNLSSVSILNILGIENNSGVVNLSPLNNKADGNFFTEGIFLRNNNGKKTKTIYFCKTISFNIDDSDEMYKGLHHVKILLIPILFDSNKDQPELPNINITNGYASSVNISNANIIPQNLIIRNNDFFKYYVYSDMKYDELNNILGNIVSEPSGGISGFRNLSVFNNNAAYISKDNIDTYLRLEDKANIKFWSSFPSNTNNFKLYQIKDSFVKTYMPNNIISGIYRYIFSVPFRNYFYGKMKIITNSQITTDSLIYLKSEHKNLSYQINNYMNSGYVVSDSGTSRLSYLKISPEIGFSASDAYFKAYIPNKYRPSSGMMSISFEGFKSTDGTDLIFDYYC